MQDLVAKAHRLTENARFQTFIVLAILVNAAIIGMETYPGLVSEWGDTLHTADQAILGIFVVEVALRMIACGPGRFFRSGWNVFDFFVVAAAFVPGLQGQTTILRMIRLLRVLRLLTTLPSLQVLVAALLYSIPRIGQMALLASLLFYVYAVMGTSLFGEHDPQHWGTLHIAFLSLFRTLTLEDWTDLMYTGMEMHPWAWVYFVSFVLLATFIIFNMLIGIILNSMEEARAQIHAEQIKEEPHDLEAHLKSLRENLDALEDHLKAERRRKPKGDPSS